MENLRIYLAISVVVFCFLWMFIHWRKTGAYLFLGCLSLASSGVILILPREVFESLIFGDYPPLYYPITLLVMGVVSLVLSIYQVYIRKAGEFNVHIEAMRNKAHGELLILILEEYGEEEE